MSIRLRITIWIQQREIKGRLLARNNFTDELAGNGSKAQSHHRMARGNGQVRKFSGAAEVRQAIGRTRAQPDPWFHVREIFRSELRKIFRNSFDDAAHTGRIDVFIEADRKSTRLNSSHRT